jgi:dihydrofolate synthase/folylpolyglutamate synthase
MSENAYQEALDYLYSFIDYSVERSYRYSADVFELQRVFDLLHELGDPQSTFKSFHIAGTKGKGSVSAMLASILQAGGYRVGLYTSPHLTRFNERIQIGALPIEDQELVSLVDSIKPAVAQVEGLTVFEISTAMAFKHFANQQVDYAVVEVGLGGRLDATNVLQPEVSVITSISYDHMHLLGESLTDIAREKAGIIKEGIPVIIAPQPHEAEITIERIATERGAPLVSVGRDWLYSAGAHDLDGQALYIWSRKEQPLMDSYVESAGDEEWAPPKYWIPLLGFHQVVNAAVAYATIIQGVQRGLELPSGSIRKGFASVHWPGRLQILSRSPLLVIDSAHNRESALKLRIALDDYFPGQPVTLVFGASADKDIEGMLIELLPRVSKLIVTRSQHPRAEDPARLAEFGHSHGVAVESFEDITGALKAALDHSNDHRVTLVAGSIFVAGQAIEAWASIQADRLGNQRGDRI